MVKLGFLSQALFFLAIGFVLGTTVAFAHARGQEIGIASTLLDNSPSYLSEQKI